MSLDQKPKLLSPTDNSLSASSAILGTLPSPEAKLPRTTIKLSQRAGDQRQIAKGDPANRKQIKGPATAPTVPSHGSTNPQKDTEMNEATNTTAAQAPSSAEIGIIDLSNTVEDLWSNALDVQRMARLLMSDLEEGLRISRGRLDGSTVTLMFQEPNIDVTIWLMGRLWSESDTLARNLMELSSKLEKMS